MLLIVCFSKTVLKGGRVVAHLMPYYAEAGCSRPLMTRLYEYLYCLQKFAGLNYFFLVILTGLREF
jgi:hypothetical protein